MDNKVFSFLLLLFMISCFVAQVLGKRQSEALSHLYKSKFNLVSKIQKGNFEANRHIKGVEVLPQEGMKERDRIKKLPGQPHTSVDFAQYGGYVTVNKTAGRALYYYFVEAQHTTNKSLPLLLWLNGGPGCSSLAFGAMQELGPFRIHSDGKTLYANKFAWNYAANVLFLESPAGVGFSYSNKTSDFTRGGDKATASDNYVFLLNWLERFPEYKTRDFYIAGESYAGHYVPQLAHTILHFNKVLNQSLINLKGIIVNRSYPAMKSQYKQVGNAVINDETDLRGMYDYWASHALITDDNLSQLKKYCDFSPTAINQTHECDAASDEAEMNLYHIDIYNIYASECRSLGLTAKPEKSNYELNYDPCSDMYVYGYMNRPDVQKALHANVTKIPYDWQSCSEVIEQWRDSPSTMIPLLQEFMANGLRVWIFSGDTDGRIPVTSTKYSINKMNLTVKTLWHPWFIDGQVGGYTEVYNGDLTFVTVRGAGHQVPSYQPKRALSVIMHFLSGTPLPNTSRLD